MTSIFKKFVCKNCGAEYYSEKDSGCPNRKCKKLEGNPENVEDISGSKKQKLEGVYKRCDIESNESDA